MKISDGYAKFLNHRVWESELGLDGVEVVNVIRDLLADRAELLEMLSAMKDIAIFHSEQRQRLERVGEDDNG